MKELLRWPFAFLFLTSGVGHLARPAWFLRLMPPYLPWHRALVFLSGVAEIALGAVLVAVFPANVHMALTSAGPAPAVPGVSPFWAWARLPVQGLLIAWAYWYA